MLPFLQCYTVVVTISFVALPLMCVDVFLVLLFYTFSFLPDTSEIARIDAGLISLYRSFFLILTFKQIIQITTKAGDSFMSNNDSAIVQNDSTTNVTDNHKNPVGRPPKFTCPDTFDRLVESYFIQENKPWTVTGVALWLDINKDTLVEYGKKPQYSATVKRARERIEQQLEQMLLTQGTNTVGIIFNLKNNFGWKDKQEVDISSEKGFKVNIHIVDK